MENRQTVKERGFSVELDSKSNLRNVSIANGGHSENVLIEGSIGALRRARFAEGVILEVVGTKGVVRIDLRPEEIVRRQDKDDDA